MRACSLILVLIATCGCSAYRLRPIEPRFDIVSSATQPILTVIPPERSKLFVKTEFHDFVNDLRATNLFEDVRVSTTEDSELSIQLVPQGPQFVCATGFSITVVTLGILPWRNQYMSGYEFELHYSGAPIEVSSRAKVETFTGLFAPVLWCFGWSLSHPKDTEIENLKNRIADALARPQAARRASRGGLWPRDVAAPDALE